MLRKIFLAISHEVGKMPHAMGDGVKVTALIPIHEKCH
jgi:hypothetical protein